MILRKTVLHRGQLEVVLSAHRTIHWKQNECGDFVKEINAQLCLHIGQNNLNKENQLIALI